GKKQRDGYPQTQRQRAKQREQENEGKKEVRHQNPSPCKGSLWLCNAWLSPLRKTSVRVSSAATKNTAAPRQSTDCGIHRGIFSRPPALSPQRHDSNAS